MKILVITDGQSYTSQYVSTLLAQGHDVYVQTQRTTQQVTQGRSLTIDLFHLSEVQYAMSEMSLVVIIGDPIRSYTQLTQANRYARAKLVYDNLARAISGSEVQHVLIIQRHLDQILSSILRAYDVPMSYKQAHFLKWSLRGSVIRPVMNERHTVRSIQNLTIPEGMSMDGVLSMYGRFLKTLNGRLINGVYDGRYFTIMLSLFRIPLIRMEHIHAYRTPSHAEMKITGGLLVAKGMRQSRFELRRMKHSPTQCVIALHDFVPRLPWHLYRMTQAPVHVAVSMLFRKYWERFNRA
ncbi:hypothetical protein [Staphylococcus sp. 17KM0847]|uniref:hypothetical protein n=1 Tax=Staphylococcus sp. 17KM0847 TaxID=2583989 RepID=UPI0015DCE866|nr:hypothetical protein [Staphylococcus sp. 17KM0847]QLK86809.1 hypothetical protein FGL66_08930 [Staphylococcus sp. 17KM0847]